MKLHNLALTALLALPLLSGCTPKLQNETPLPELFTNAELDGKLVTTTGLLRLSTGMMGKTSCEGSRCSLDLWLPDGSAEIGHSKSIRVNMLTGTGENQMAELPEKYAKTDLKVKAMGGKIIAHGDKTKLTGTLRCKIGSEPSLPCSMDVDRVDVP
jgi:hypothetical protein